MQYTLVGTTEDGSNISVFVPDKAPLVAHSTHPNFEKIVAGAVAGDESIVDLFNAATTAVTKFERLTERVTTANGRLFLDGEEVHDALAQQVVRFLSEDVEDWKPLVAFFENVQNNPEAHSREQLYSWLKSQQFTITNDGLIVGYKGVHKTKDGFESLWGGKAIVDGVVHSGQIPQKVGSVVEMPRSEVTHDPQAACSTGLHVGTFRYAKDYARGAMLEVHVNPRDVVSVPDGEAEKMRVCRYRVVRTLDGPHSAPVVEDYDDGNDEWGDGEGSNDQLTVDAPETPQPEKKVVTRDGVVSVGDVYESTDSRRKGTTFRVDKVDGKHAHGVSLPANISRKIKLSRLTSRKYRKV